MTEAETRARTYHDVFCDLTRLGMAWLDEPTCQFPECPLLEGVEFAAIQEFTEYVRTHAPALFEEAGTSLDGRGGYPIFEVKNWPEDISKVSLDQRYRFWIMNAALCWCTYG